MSAERTENREARFLRVYQQVTRLISLQLDHQKVMDTIVRTLPDLMGVDACSIRLLDSSTSTFVLGAAHGLSMEYLSRPAIDNRKTMELVRAGKPVANPDIDTDPTYEEHETAAREGIRSVLTLPILFQGSIIGIMRLLTRTRHVFSRFEIDFAMTLAEQVGIAISNGRMITELENQVDFMQEVQEITRLVNSTLDLDRILQTIVERIPASMGHRACAIRLLNPQTNQLELVAAHGLSREYLDHDRVESEKGIKLVLSGKPVTIYDVAGDRRISCRREMAREGIRSLLAVPVREGKEITGILKIMTEEPHCFTSAEVNFAVTAAESGAMAIRNARTYRKVNLLFQQIEENERFLSDILDCIRPQLLVVDRNRHVVLVNRVFTEARGLEESSVLGRSYHDLCRFLPRNEPSPVERVFQEGTTAVSVHRVVINERERWLERTASPMFDREGQVEYVIEVIRDITTQKKLEQKQLHLTRLRGVVEMAGTVAHEINSPLFAALGTAQLLEEELRDQPLAEDVTTIIRNLRAIERLTARMIRTTGFEEKKYVGGTSIVDLQ